MSKKFRQKLQGPKQRLLIVGSGKLGSRLAECLQHDFELSIASRSASKHPRLANFVEHCFDADVSKAESLKAVCAQPYDYILYCLAPKERSENTYRQTYLAGWHNVLSHLTQPEQLKRVFFVSSTSVYHQHDGLQINEQSPTQPSAYSGKVLLEAEAVPAKLRAQGLLTCPSTNIRFSGIYGGSRNMLREQVREKRAFYSSQVRLSNRIHEDDCVAVLAFLLRLAAKGEELEEVYLASDGCPVDMNEVYAYIAKQEGVELESSDEIGKRRAGNKRCDNSLLKALGYQFIYPSYKEGYAR